MGLDENKTEISSPIRKLQDATDIGASILEGREGEEEGGVNFDLRMLYGGLVGMVDDVEEISYEL